MVVYLQCNTNDKAESVLTFYGRQLICIGCRHEFDPRMNGEEVLVKGIK